MKIPEIKIPIIEIPYNEKVQLFMKREDVIHPEISGNKFWKLFYSINHYLKKNVKYTQIITFGGAFSNHIAAVSAVGKLFEIPTLGIIRGDELQNLWQENPTLQYASKNGMKFNFVSREEYRNKKELTATYQQNFPDSLLIPEGGTNELAVEGIKMMLNSDTKDFDYLCIAVGTGGSIAGVSKFANENQKVIGMKVVKDSSLENKISELTSKQNFHLINADFGGYGKIKNEIVEFINNFKNKYTIPLDPIYTGKMMKKVFELIDEDYFPEGSKILCFHTGGLQGIEGANFQLKKKNKNLII